MAQVPGQLTAETGAQADTDINHLSLDGKTLRGSKDADGKAEHVVSAFCVPWTRVWALYRRTARGWRSPMPCSSLISLT